MDKNSKGIYCVEDRCFYYLECGPIHVVNTLDRLKRTLTKRKLIEFSEITYADTKRYKVMTCKDAKLDGLKMIPVFISKHVKELVQGDGESNQEKGKGGWNKKKPGPKKKK